ncbi:MAG: sensor histidine kinase [Dehalococcoidia bacterium]
MSLSCADRHEWIEADLRPYQVTAAQLAAAIDSRRQQMLLFERGQQIAVLEERRRLARELHDSVTQSLVGMSLLSQAIPDLWEIDRDEARASLRQIHDQTRSALAEMRALLVELRPPEAGTESLARRLRHHIAAFEQRTGMIVAAAIDERLELPGEIVQALARIAQEALTNIARHAGARHVSVTLTGADPTRLLITDDGCGFDSADVSDGSLGLISMRERAAGIDATIEINTRVGRGTTVAVTWPTSITAID